MKSKKKSETDKKDLKSKNKKWKHSSSQIELGALEAMLEKKLKKKTIQKNNPSED